jgi:hypothetical protein
MRKVLLFLAFAFAAVYLPAQNLGTSPASWLTGTRSGVPTQTCSATSYNGVFAASSALNLYQCSNITGTYQWNQLGSAGVVSSCSTGTACPSGVLTTVGHQPFLNTYSFSGQPPSGQVNAFQVGTAVTIPSGCASPLTGVAASSLTAYTAATASSVFTFVDETTSTTLCTFTFAASGTTATVTGSGGTINSGDIVKWVAPSPQDATLAGIKGAVNGVR